ncbi:MAG: hypothetical protein COB71_05920 [Thiotrichales bacterium]|nr:MAG: hypothetical protein COB71_05920 [Thiotrichales bacterium]
MVVMDQYSQGVIGFSVHTGAMDGPTLCCMSNRIKQGQGTPKYLSTDNDPLFRYHHWRRTLLILAR